MGHVLAAAKLLFRTPKLWPAALAPMLIAVVANLGLLIFSLQKLVPWFGTLADRQNIAPGFGWTVAGTVVAGAWILVAGPIFLMMFGILSVPAWDALSRQVEVTVNGTVPTGRLSCLGMIADASVRLVTALILGGTAFLLGCFGFGIVGAVLCGWLMLFDLSGPTFARRGVSIFKQYREVFRCPGWQGFWIAASLSCIVPVINVLVLPVLVVAATLMVLDKEQKAKAFVAQPVE